MNKIKIVILSGQNKSTNIIFNSLRKEFTIEKVIIEKHIPMGRFFKRRIKTLGIIKVMGQLLFLILIVPIMKITSKNRLKQIKKKYKLVDDPIKNSKILNLSSINSIETMKILRKYNPGLVIINGTRIISETILNSIDAKFINTHAGINPLYRGLHGGYWALIENNINKCGFTVHLVDAGIDTGNILEQGLIKPSKDDNFVTYPLLQLAEGLPLLKKAINDIFNNKMVIKPNPEGISKFWSHPSLWEYLLNRIIYKVK